MPIERPLPKPETSSACCWRLDVGGALTRTLSARNADPIPDHAVVLVTGVLEQLVIGIELQREPRSPRVRKHNRIFGLDLINQELIVYAGELLGDFHLLARGEAISR